MTAGSPLSGLEVATGMVFGASEGRERLPEPAGRTPLRALERAILPALLRPPCLVSFSGGRDSSAVLAVAVALARREGLAPPIPATNAFPDVASAEEGCWQERVVRHLGLREWVRIEHSDGLDLIGPYAQRALRRHGLLWPFNVHFHLPLLDAARGGSLLTGVGGDELFEAATRDRVAALLARAVRPETRDLLRVAFAFAPAAVRRSVLARRNPVALPWLRPEALRAATAALAGWGAHEPRGLADRLAWTRRSHYLHVVTAALSLTAEDTDVLLVHPLLSGEVWAEVARAAGPLGFDGRTDGIRRILGRLLPADVCARTSKASFNGAFWTERARGFVRSWRGGGVPEEWVDPSALLAHWLGEQPVANSFTLLQAAWLESADRVEQPLDRVSG